MSTEQKPTENQMSADEAIKVAFRNILGVHQHVFFSKLASRGYAPESAEQAQEMMDTAADVVLAEKTAQAQEPARTTADPFKVAHQALRGVLEGTPAGTVIKQAGTDNRRDTAMQVAWELAQDPNIYNSALLLKRAQDQALAAQAQASA